MLSEAQRGEVSNWLTLHIQGGVCQDFMSIFDEAIEDGLITQETFDKEEIELAGIYDDGFFQCESCSWVVPVSQRSFNVDDCCDDCEPENDDA